MFDIPILRTNQYLVYLHSLGGILAGYGNLAIRESKAQTLFNLSDIHVDVVGNFYIFNPEVNQELVGKIKHSEIFQH